MYITEFRCVQIHLKIYILSQSVYCNSLFVSSANGVQNKRFIIRVLTISSASLHAVMSADDKMNVSNLH